jgi:hemerythrin-like metal-binding protein
MIEWNDELSVNNPQIDKEHQGFISIMNELNGNFLSEDAENSILKTLDRLNEYAENHLSNEEKLMRETGYPGAFVHKQRHNEFRAQIKDFNKAYRKNRNGSDGQELLYFLQIWFIKHIKNEDKWLSPFLEKAGTDGDGN